MSKIMVVGGGIAGCTAALELAKEGRDVILVEKASVLGGKTRLYGCKSDGECTNCGVCLTRGVFDAAENKSGITVLTRAFPIDCAGVKGDFTVTLNVNGKIEVVEAVAYVLLAVGFDQPSAGFISIEGSMRQGVHTGSEMEEMLQKAGNAGVFFNKPDGVAFIQCCGSRSTLDKAPYCSRICCGYSTRMACAMRRMYPQCEIDMYYMDIQEVESGDYPQKLNGLGISLNRCRVSRISANKRCRVWFELDGKQTSKEYDHVILCTGIRPNKDNTALAEIFSLDVDANDFLISDNCSTGNGVIPIGCASAPKGIIESITLAKHAAFMVLAEVNEK